MSGSSSRMVVCEAPAKINLSLHVTGLRSDGYHNIDTIVAFAGIGDRVVIQEADGPKSGVGFAASGPFSGALGEDSANLVLRAAHSFNSFAGGSAVKPIQLMLEKNLPLASGI
ncbi:MAG: 4-(cytidine 5'-diphospho)-2-C-methyl-D-erythritol kinase, partial [Rhizobiaceae bacterium]